MSAISLSDLPLILELLNNLRVCEMEGTIRGREQAMSFVFHAPYYMPNDLVCGCEMGALVKTHNVAEQALVGSQFPS